MNHGRFTIGEAHRYFAVECFNLCWSLIEKPRRTPEEDRTMVTLAMASRWHWKQATTCRPVNFARSEWQVSRVLSITGQGAAALDHAASGLQCCLENDIGDFDLAFAHESLARAHAALDQWDERDVHHERALRLAQTIGQKEDRDYFLKELATVPARPGDERMAV